MQITKSLKRLLDAMECSVNKVFASETLSFIADEGVQIYGGYGFIQEYKIERIYRDCRINRIFEGTNEINRLLIPSTFFKHALKGDLPFLQKVQSLQNELLAFVPNQSFEKVLDAENDRLQTASNLFLMISSIAIQKYQMNIEKEQEVVSVLADMIIQLFVAQSAFLRTKKRIEKWGIQHSINAIEMTQVLVYDMFRKMEACAKEILPVLQSGDILDTQLSILKKLTRTPALNTIVLKRNIATRITQLEKYII